MGRSGSVTSVTSVGGAGRGGGGGGGRVGFAAGGEFGAVVGLVGASFAGRADEGVGATHLLFRFGARSVSVMMHVRLVRSNVALRILYCCMLHAANGKAVTSTLRTRGTGLKRLGSCIHWYEAKTPCGPAGTCEFRCVRDRWAFVRCQPVDHRCTIASLPEPL